MSVRLLQGFSARWRKHPHRVNKLGVELSPAGVDVITRGGTWTTGRYGSDSMDLSARALVVDGPLAVVEGSTSPLGLSGSVRLRRSRPAEASTTVELELPPGLREGPLAVVLRGFAFDTDVSHTAGYTLRGLGVGLGMPTRDGDRVRFAARARLEAGGVPDRAQGLRRYGAEARIHYTVLGGPEVRLNAGRHTHTVRSGAGIHPARPRATPTQRRVRVQGTAGLPVGCAAWRGFELRLNPEQRLLAGRYLRRLSLDLSDSRYDAEQGALELSCDGHVSNSGLVSWPLTCAFSADLVLIQLPRGGVQALAGQGPQQAERTTLELEAVHG